MIFEKAGISDAVLGRMPERQERMDAQDRPYNLRFVPPHQLRYAGMSHSRTIMARNRNETRPEPHECRDPS